MKKLNFVPKTKKAGLITAAVVAGLVVGGFGVSRSEAAMDWLGLEQKLQHIDERNDNQDDRISNTEADVQELQNNTNTQPSSEKVVVREVTTPNPTLTQTPEQTPAPAPSPIVVTSFEQITLGEDTDCKFTYSDNTTYQWHWKVVTYNQGSKITSTSGSCDSSQIGKPKV